MWILGLKGLKGLCHDCLVHIFFVNIANYAFLCAVELNGNEENTCKRQNQMYSFVSNKYAISQALYQTLQTRKVNFEKLS